MYKPRQTNHSLSQRNGWTLWERWVLAMAISGMIAMGIVAAAIVTVKLTGTTNLAAVMHIVGFLEGTVLGFAQWLVLRRYIQHMTIWMVVTTIAALIAWLLGTKFSILLAFAYFHVTNGEKLAALFKSVALLGAWVGTVLGFAQWLVLEIRIPRALWWIAANALAWAVGLLIAFIGAGMVQADELTVETILTGAATGATMGAVIGSITGTALVWLLKPNLHSGKNRHY